MGEHSVSEIRESAKRQSFIRHLLDDVKALEQVLSKGLFETGITRIGAEQELCLIDEAWNPSLKSMEILEDVDEAHFTTELARFNLEINLDPQDLDPGCLQRMRVQLETLLDHARKVSEKHQTRLLLTGILPTIRNRELALDYMTPHPRYFALNEMLKKSRGSDFTIHIQGVDELCIRHDSVLFEACNTSFQLHLQVDPEDFVASYNWAQAISGPILSMCTNSPLLLGRELWSETRIALFQQSIDTRGHSYSLLEKEPRVTFGHAWIRDSVLDIYKDDISRFRVLISSEIEDSSLAQLDRGEAPDLKALMVHNGTVYRWNRPCYGVHNGVPHLRIENRYIPSGPTVPDEMANMALWLGLMLGRPEQYSDIADRMDFRDVKDNFYKAARSGKAAQMRWLGKWVPACELARDHLLPMAREGLQKAGFENSEIDRYLGIIASRLDASTGSEWLLDNYRALQRRFKPDESLSLLTRGAYERQWQGAPVHEWSAMDVSGLKREREEKRVGRLMSTDLLTVQDDDLVDLVWDIMRWHKIHHVPVENDSGDLVGILSWNDKKEQTDSKEILAVHEVMNKDPLSTSPEASIEAANQVMIDNGIGSLPVIQAGRVIGILTKNDVLEYLKDKS